MAALMFVARGLAFAILAGVVGTIVAAIVEVVIALRDPVRGPVIRNRSWRRNLHHMLH